MTLSELPAYWKDRIKDRFGARGIGTSDFKNGTVEILFQDESSVAFHDYYDLIDEQRDEILIMTEHCGYHVFPLAEGANVIVRKNISQEKA